MKTSSSSENSTNALEILKYWYLIEHFTPYDLKPYKSYDISFEELQQKGNTCLPWLDESSFAAAGGEIDQHYKYIINFIPFDKNELTKISKKLFPLEDETIDHVELEERLSDEGTTCFAQITVDHHGQPNWSSLSLSTMPWAVGKLLQNKQSEINSQCYHFEEIQLISLLDRLAKKVTLDSLEYTGNTQKEILTTSHISDLIQLLYDWAGFRPEFPIEIVIVPQYAKKTNLIVDVPENEQDEVLSEIIEAETDHEDDHENFPHEELPILNSFYIKDLEKIINHVALNKDAKALYAYLSNHVDNKTDVYKPENKKYLLNRLSPQYINKGRWPNPSSHNMSFMQQVAINECFHRTGDYNIFSVNGPPGTGKTTMLQEIIAENIVQRAKKLAALSSANMAFKKTISVTFTNNEKDIVAVLDDNLVGYEMVVVSSNNAAVENISKDLPKLDKIAKEYRSSCKYLTSIATKLKAEHKDRKVKPLNDKPWGLISAAMGKTANKSTFREGVFFKPDTPQQAKQRVEKGIYKNIWEWRENHQCKSFKQAQKEFIEADKKLDNFIHELSKLKELINQINSEKYTTHILSLDEKIGQLDKKCLDKKQKIDLTNTEIICKKKDRELILTRIHELNTVASPSFWHRIFRTYKWKIYKNEIEHLQQELINISRSERKLKKNLTTFKTYHKEMDEQLNCIRVQVKCLKQEKQRLQLEYNTFIEKHEDIILPPSDGELNDDKVQLSALWQNKHLNELRTQEFILALKLHESWLAEVINSEFRGNIFSISRLLDNKSTVDSEHALSIWQSLFMWLPVISSTFASVATQFKQIGANELGWLLIDEAGQAIPQAATGAIWRSQNVLVVGDPLQIEPVFTIPPSLVKGLAKQGLGDNYHRWLPTITSVQTLADNSNNIGASINQNGVARWIGCPLRVHRRCLNPMFEVSNEIAYEEKMVNARIKDIDNTLYPLGESCWFHVTGEVTDKQFVEEQAGVLLDIITKLYQYKKKLPDVYIIAPFKIIKENLKNMLSNKNNWPSSLATSLPSNNELNKWCNNRIGTVHTFQGKEEKTVIFVLGADPSTEGSANWAAAKPNLLNVALTRAKDRIYIIGDKRLWGKKSHFNVLARTIKVIEYSAKQQTISV